MIKITISTKNSTFQDGGLCRELAIILGYAAAKLLQGIRTVKLYDSEGNSVGWAESVYEATGGCQLVGEGLVITLEDDNAFFAEDKNVGLFKILQEDLENIRQGHRDLSGSSPYRDDSGNPVGTLQFFQDVNMEEADATVGSTFHYFINKDERGEFSADVRNSDGNTVFDALDFSIFEDGFMKHKHDLEGLTEYLLSLGIIESNDKIIAGD